MTIYNGNSVGGTVVGTSSSAATTTLGGFPAVAWTFTGGLSLTDNLTYTAAFTTPNFDIAIGMPTSTSGTAYSNGFAFEASATISGADRVFQGQFTAVPFEFSPVGLAALGGAIWMAKRLSKFHPATKQDH